MFPDLKSPNSSSPLGDRLYDEFSSGLRKAISNEAERKKVIHSFRHSLGNNLKQARVHTESEPISLDMRVRRNRRTLLRSDSSSIDAGGAEKSSSGHQASNAESDTAAPVGLRKGATALRKSPQTLRISGISGPGRTRTCNQKSYRRQRSNERRQTQVLYFIRELQDGAPAPTFEGDCRAASPSFKLFGPAGCALVPL